MCCEGEGGKVKAGISVARLEGNGKIGGGFEGTGHSC